MSKQYTLQNLPPFIYPTAKSTKDLYNGMQIVPGSIAEATAADTQVDKTLTAIDGDLSIGMGSVQAPYQPAGAVPNPKAVIETLNSMNTLKTDLGNRKSFRSLC